MKSKSILSLVVVMLFTAALLSAAGGLLFVPSNVDDDAILSEDLIVADSPSEVGGKRLVDLRADDAYYISKGDSTIFILVGNFAAHHNGAVIMADSAVRYSNQSFECFGNVLINQNDTYVYGERAEYNNQTAEATVYSKLVKIVDGDALMYTYHCKYNTSSEIGEFSGGCFVETDDNLLEAERGYYNTKTHDLTAVQRVEMRDDTYQMRGDSVIFNTQTENARYFTHSNIWNDKDEYLYADAGSYDKERDLHHLTSNAYILSPEREIWSDSIEYYRTDGHIIGRRNIQMDDIEQNIKSFADYGEWWDEPGNALFTGRPSMINYDAEAQDSVYLSADTLWLYTIAVEPPATETKDSTSMDADKHMDDTSANVADEQKSEQEERKAAREERKEERKAAREERKEEREQKRQERKADGIDEVATDDKAVGESMSVETAPAEMESAAMEQVATAELAPADEAQQTALVESPLVVEDVVEDVAEEVVEEVVEEAVEDIVEEAIETAAEEVVEDVVEDAVENVVVVDDTPVEEQSIIEEQPVDVEPLVEQKDEAFVPEVVDEVLVVEIPKDTTTVQNIEFRGGYLTTMTLDELAERQSYLPEPVEVQGAKKDSVAADTKPLTAKELRRKAKIDEKNRRDSIKAQQLFLKDSVKAMARAERDSLRRMERIEQDSLKALEQILEDSLYKLKYGERDSLRLVESALRDSLRKMEVDTLIAKRKERSARLADEEKAHMERVQLKVQEYQRKKIERAKARAARRGKEYKGPEFEDLFPDAIVADSLDGDSHADAHADAHDHDHGEATVANDSLAMGADSLMTNRDSLTTGADSMAGATPSFPADSSYKMVKAYRNVRMFRSDSQMVCDSLVTLNTDSIVRLYKDPVMWNESNQITSDSMAVYTRDQKMEKAHFMGEPLMIGQIDTMYYNQVKGKDMTAYFAEGQVARNEVEGNAQTIYFMQEEENPDVTGLMYIESASITFYFDEGQIGQIVYKQNPEYVLYPMDMIPETQTRRLPNFAWHGDMRPTRDSVLTRIIRPSQREAEGSHAKPTFRITESINYERRRLTENNMWIDRIDVLPPDVVEWRNSRPSYKQRNNQ